jgi:hypothetical protein
MAAWNATCQAKRYLAQDAAMMVPAMNGTE